MYCFTVLVFSLIMIYGVVPKYGRKNPLVYLSICSLVGSVSVMAIKGFGVALKLSLGGNNQFSHPSTYVFGIVTALCILIQMNYFNKALDTFSTNVYVIFVFSPFLSLMSYCLVHVQSESYLLCRILYCDTCRVAHPVPRSQHYRRNHNGYAPLRVHNYLPRCPPPQHFPYTRSTP